MPNILFSTNTGFIVEWSPETGEFMNVYDLGRYYSDIAIAPDGQLFGITFDSLYRIDLATRTDSFVGGLNGALTPFINGLDSANGFDIAPDGTAIVTSGENHIVAEVNLSNGSVSNVGLLSFTESAGDVLFHEGSLFVSTTSYTLVEMRESNGRWLRVGSDFVGSDQIYGLGAPAVEGLGLTAFVGSGAYDLDVPGSTLGPGLIQGFNIPGGFISGAASTDITIPPPVDEPTTAETVFKAYAKGNIGGQGTFLALLAQAAYHLDSREIDRTQVNNPDPEATDAYFEVRSRLKLLDAADMPSLALRNSPDADFPTIGLANGIFTNQNAAALVARSSDALFVSFRGTNDRTESLFDSASPDRADWFQRDEHYALFAPLIAAIKSYAGSGSDIDTIYLTGHSLGGGMVEALVQEWDDPRLQAVTFASSSYPGSAADDAQLSNIWLEGDVVNLLVFLTNNDGDDNTINSNLAGLYADYLNRDGTHDMLTYRAFVEFFRDEGIDLGAAQVLHGIEFDQFHAAVDTSRGELSVGTGSDRIIGSGLVEAMFGGDNHDTISGLGSTDFLSGGRGNDKLYGNVGNDILRGGPGNDELDGGVGIDTVDHSNAPGGVQVYLNAGLSRGAAGYDRLANIENLLGSAHDDRLVGDAGKNLIRGGAGDDIIKGKGGNDTFFGEAGNDRIRGENRVETFHGGAGDDILLGLAGNDTLNGEGGVDYIYGGRDNDVIDGGDGGDFLRGNLGQDRIFGREGEDDIRGGGMDDHLLGGAGNDFLLGEGGSDRLDGGTGDDVLFGGFGAGVNDGQRDTFVFAPAGSGAGGFDRIRDFENGVDRIDLTAFGFTDFASEVAVLASSAAGGTAVRIDFGDGDVLYLEDFTTGAFGASDVILA